MTSIMERNGELLNELDTDAPNKIDDTELHDNEETEKELTVPNEQSKLDTVRKLSSGFYQSASGALGAGVGSVKRAASGLGAGLSRAGQNMADKLQKSPKIGKAMKKRGDYDELHANILSDDSDSEDENSTLMAKKSSKEIMARKKRQEAIKKEEETTK